MIYIALVSGIVDVPAIGNAVFAVRWVRASGRGLLDVHGLVILGGLAHRSIHKFPPQMTTPSDRTAFLGIITIPSRMKYDPPSPS
jgi:hypothetical protein